MISKGSYQVEWEGIVYGSYRGLEMAEKALAKAKQGCYRRRREYFIKVLNTICSAKFLNKEG